MSFDTACPGCKGQVRVPDHLVGQTVRCPVCEITFIATSESSPPLESVNDTFRETAEQPEAPPPPVPKAESIRRPIPRLDDDDVDDDDEDDDDGERFSAREERYRERVRTGRIERARTRVVIPAIGLMVVGVLDLLEALGGLLFGAYMATVAPGGGGPAPRQMIFVQLGMFGTTSFILFVCGALILYGAIRMKQNRSYGMAVTGCVFAVISAVASCCFGLLGVINLAAGLTFGIWGFVVLADADVKASFK